MVSLSTEGCRVGPVPDGAAASSSQVVPDEAVDFGQGYQAYKLLHRLCRHSAALMVTREGRRGSNSRSRWPSR